MIRRGHIAVMIAVVLVVAAALLATCVAVGDGERTSSGYERSTPVGSPFVSPLP
jgi:hypothetical protein